MRVIKFKDWVKQTKRAKQIEAWRNHASILSKILEEVYMFK